MHKLVKYYFVVFALFPGIVSGQRNGPYAGELAKISMALKGLYNVRYDYLLTADYPNSQKDKLEGQVFVGNDRRIFYNSNDAFTILYTDSWFYKADHAEKTVALVNLNKHLNKDFKKRMEMDLFAQHTVSVYLDSVVQRYGIVKGLKKNGDTIKMDIGFPDRMPLKMINLVFDDKAKILVSYSMRLYQPWHNDEFGKDKGTTEIITCRNFKRVSDNKAYSPENFFVVRKNKVALKKYSGYKLTSKL